MKKRMLTYRAEGEGQQPFESVLRWLQLKNINHEQKKRTYLMGDNIDETTKGDTCVV